MSLTSRTLFFLIFLASSCSIGRYSGPVGSFHGLLPCADCPGIAASLTLNADHTCTIEQRYMDRELQPTVTQATFTYSRSGRILLSEPILGMTNLQVEGETLVFVDEAGQKIKTNFPDRYILSREVPEEVHFDGSEEMFFRATGNEPFWMVEISPSGMIHFQALGPEEINVSFPMVNQEPSEPGVYSMYSGASDDGHIEIIARVSDCSDDMSGETRTNSVKVNFQLTNQEKPQAYSGCGNYLTPYDLHDVWELVSMNNQPIERKENSQAPYLILNALNSTMTGTGGCNRINATFLLRGKTLTFGPCISTKMACPNLDQEQAFISAISEQTLKIKMDDNLTLFQGNSSMTFRRKR